MNDDSPDTRPDPPPPSGNAPINLASDNVTGCCAEIRAALDAAADGPAIPYAGDPWTAEAEKRLRTVFDKPDLQAFLVTTGTAANSLALAAVTPPWGAVLCHTESHVNVDECGAPEFFTAGAKLLPLEGAEGKLDAEMLRTSIRRAGARGGVHRVKPAAVSITQATELGTVYRPEEVAAVASVCRAHGLALHMDGARFANALATLDAPPAEITWKAGVDILTLGASKNGAWACEAVVFFDPALAEGMGYRRKRAGHLLSKGRFLGVQMCAYLQDGVWLRNARHANAMARRLADGLGRAGHRPLYPVEANEVFVDLPGSVQDRLRTAGFLFVPWLDAGPDVVRLVTTYDTRPEEIDAFLAAVGAG